MKPTTIGIIGGGQLGKMFIENASKLSVPIYILDRDEHCPASTLAQQHIVGSITDADDIQKLADVSAYIVTGKQIGRASCRERVYVLV